MLFKLKLDKSLIPLKLVLFTYYGAAACILPYLTVHMRQIGITVGETAIVYAVLPVVSFIGPPIAGFFADRLGRFQPVLIVSLVAVAVFHTSLLAIPPVSNVDGPAHVELVCSGQGQAVLRVEKCETDEECPPTLHVPDWDVRQCSRRCGGTPTSPVASQSVNASSRTDPKLRLLPAITINSTNDVPTNLTCDYQLPYGIFAQDINRTFVMDNESTCPFQSAEFENGGDCIVTCPVHLADDADLDLLPVCERFVGNHLLTFATYFLLRVIGGVFLSICFTLLDATCFAMIEKHKGEYGKQKIGSIIATSIFSPITGFLIDHMTHVKGYADYSPAFYVFDGLIIITVFLSTRLKFQLDNPTEKMLHNLLQLLKKVEVVSFLIMIFFLGAMWGFVETFLFWYMLDLGSPKYLLGLTVTIGSMVSVPVLFSAEKIVRKVGNITLLITAFAVYAVRMIGYSFIYNPWWSLIFESMEVFTINLMWVAAATYGNAIAPKGLLATMQGAMGGIHFGIGRGVGSFVGGLLMQHFGTRMTFRIMGVTNGVVCTASFIFYVAYFRHLKRAQHTTKYPKDNAAINGLKNQDSQLEHMLTKEKQNGDVENGVTSL